MLIFQAYNKILLLLVVYLSHFLSAFILGMLSVIFLQWFKFGRSFSILMYAAVFIVTVFLILITLPVLTEQFYQQPESIQPSAYITLILSYMFPSPNIAVIYGLGNYALPVLVIASAESPVAHPLCNAANRSRRSRGSPAAVRPRRGAAQTCIR